MKKNKSFLNSAVVYLRSAHYGAFLYKRMIGRVEGNPENGDIVAVVDKAGKFFGWGFYNAHSKIVLRMISYLEERPDEEEIKIRIKRAVHIRKNVLQLTKTTNAYRLIHAEGDGLSGLIADYFDGYVVIEIFSLAMFLRIEKIKQDIVDAGVKVKEFFVRADEKVAEQEGFSISALKEISKKDKITVTENEVSFYINLEKGHKTGFFCDQRRNRLELTRYTENKSVLDVCCYTGGFACYAAKLGKATDVYAVDLDEKCLEVARENAKLNNVNVQFEHSDAFHFLRQAQKDHKKWDVVVVDPSKFVSRRDRMDKGLQRYSDLNQLAAGVVNDGGLMLTCSCSGLVSQELFIKTVSRAIRLAGKSMQMLQIAGASEDHPVMIDTLDSQYLKAIMGIVF